MNSTCPGCPEVARKIQVSVHCVLVHVLGISHSETGRSAPARNHTPVFFSAAYHDNHGAFEQTVKIDDQVIASASQLFEKRACILQDGWKVPLFKIFNPCFTAKDNDPVKQGVIKDKTGRRFFHHPGDVRVGIQAAQGRKRRQRRMNIAEGRDLRSEYSCPFSSIHWTPLNISAICSGLLPVFPDPSDVFENVRAITLFTSTPFTPARWAASMSRYRHHHEGSGKIEAMSRLLKKPRRRLRQSQTRRKGDAFGR
jgi:hypothetical protein